MTTNVALEAQVEEVESAPEKGVVPVTGCSNAVLRHRWASHGNNNQKKKKKKKKKRPTS